MAGYVKVWTTHWQEEWWLEMRCIERGVWIQLLMLAKERDTGDIFAATMQELCSKLRIDSRTFCKVTAYLQQKCCIHVETMQSGVIHIFIPKYQEYQSLSDPKTLIKKGREIAQKRYNENNGSRIAEQSKAEQNNIYSDIPFQEILNDLNKKANRNYRLIDKTKTLITARWREGFRLADFEYVHTVKVADWLDKPDMVKYLRPETLYSNKFEGYRNQPMPTKANPESWEHKMVENFIKGGQ